MNTKEVKTEVVELKPLPIDRLIKVTEAAGVNKYRAVSFTVRADGTVTAEYLVREEA